jgi:isocitrate dehydrogenase
MTGDLMRVADPNPSNRQVDTEEFVDAVAAAMRERSGTR